MKLLFLDTETTGVDPEKHGIIQISAEYHVNGVKVDSFNEKINYMGQQGPTIDINALKYNGTDLTRAFDKGSGFPEPNVLIQFVDWLLNLKLKDTTIVGHSVNFDFNFLKTSLKKFNTEGLDKLLGHRIEDTQYLARSMMKAGLLSEGKTNLGALAKYLEVDHKTLHDSAEDVRVTAEVYYKLLNVLKGKSNGTQPQ